MCKEDEVGNLLPTCSKQYSMSDGGDLSDESRIKTYHKNMYTIRC